MIKKDGMCSSETAVLHHFHTAKRECEALTAALGMELHGTRKVVKLPFPPTPIITSYFYQ